MRSELLLGLCVWGLCASAAVAGTNSASAVVGQGASSGVAALDVAPLVTALSVRRCGTPDPSGAVVDACRAAIHSYRREPAESPEGGTIRVAVHVLRCGGEGDVPDERIAAQIDELNRAYRSTGFRFVLDRIDHTDHCRGFRMSPGSIAERDIKTALAVDPMSDLNLYTCEPGSGLLGWAYFPQSFEEQDPMHGVVVHYQSLPGGALEPFDLGRTAVHEVGHYLGLFHTFQNGCQPPGDGVDDTPYEAAAASGCPEGRNTCEAGGDDPIHNYMDYTDDACMTEFTAGQAERMNAIVRQARPHLLLTAGETVARAKPSPRAIAEPARPEARIGTSTPGLALEVSPNPVTGPATLSFQLPRRARAQVRVFDGRGRRVRTLEAGVLDPGRHTMSWESLRLSDGVYQVELEAAGVMETRIVLVEAAPRPR